MRFIPSLRLFPRWLRAGSTSDRPGKSLSRSLLWPRCWSSRNTPGCKADSRPGASRWPTRRSRSRLRRHLHMTQQLWDQAIGELEDALHVERATNGDMVRLVLAEAQRGQAEMLLDAVGTALAHRRATDAFYLLRVYLRHPQAEKVERARQLRDELERDLSHDEAAQQLRLSDEELTVFAEKGQWTGDDALSSSATHSIFLETLRRNVAQEIRKREAQREVARLSEKRRASIALDVSLVSVRCQPFIR